MSRKGQALPQLIPLSGHQPQLNREVLYLLVHVPVSEEGRWRRRLPGGAWQEENNTMNWHLELTRSGALF